MEVRQLILLLVPLMGFYQIQNTHAQKTEWPVFFEHLGLVHSIHNKWDLTLTTALHVPKLEGRILKTIHRLKVLNEQSDKQTKAAFRSAEEKSRLQELQESWRKLNRQLSRRAETMRRRTKNLKSLGAYSETEKMKKMSMMDKMMNKRPKRDTDDSDLRQDGGNDAVIELTNGIMKALFGVAYTDDVRKVVRRIDDIDDRLMDNIGQVKNEQTSLTQNTRQTLTKQDTTIHMVEKMAKTIERKVRSATVIYLVSAVDDTVIQPSMHLGLQLQGFL